MKLAVVELTLLGLALVTHAWDNCGCLPESSGPVCGNDFKTYESECWMQCAGTELLWKGTCQDPVELPDQDKVPVHPVYDIELPTPIIHLLNPDETDPEPSSLHRISPAIADLQEPKFRRIHSPPVDPKPPTLRKLIHPLKPHFPNFRRIYKVEIQPGGYSIRPYHPLEGLNNASKDNSNKRPSHRGNVVSTIKRFGPKITLSKSESKSIANPNELRSTSKVDTSLFSVLSLPIP